MNGKRAKALRRYALKTYNPTKYANKLSTNQFKNWVRFIKNMFYQGGFEKDARRNL